MINLPTIMYHHASQPHSRRDMYNWKYYNEHFKMGAVNPRPSLAHTPQYLQYKKSNVVKKKSPKEILKSFGENFLIAFDHYCDTSTLHGLKYVGENRISKAERIFWFIAFLIAVIFAIYFITTLFINYHTSPVIVGFSPEMMAVQDIPFPALTICNFNVAYKSRAKLVEQSDNLQHKIILEDLCNFNTSNYQDPGTITWSTMEGLILNVTQLCREMLVGCRWQGKSYACNELMNSAMTDDGYCCTFNRLPSNYTMKDSDVTKNITVPSEIINWTPELGYPSSASPNIYPYRAFGRGVEQGLTLVLDAALDEYYCSTTSGFGFKAIFHTPRETPKIAELGFLLKPGVETRISIAVDIEQATDSIRDIDFVKRKCFFTNERFLRFYKLYSARNCALECEANYTLMKCDCIPYYLPRDANSRICDKSDEECSTAARFVIERFGADKMNCNCLPGCNQLIYNPGIISEGKLMPRNNIISSEFLTNFTQEYFAENMAIVHIYYNTESFRVQVKTAMYTFAEFLSNTGGLLGLFLGFSFLSVVELFYFLFIRGACIWCQNKQTKDAKEHKQNIFLQ